MQLAHGQEGRATQSAMESGVISVIPFSKTLGAGEEVFGKLESLHLVVGHKYRIGLAVEKKAGQEQGESEGKLGPMPNSHQP